MLRLDRETWSVGRSAMEGKYHEDTYQALSSHCQP